MATTLQQLFRAWLITMQSQIDAMLIILDTVELAQMGDGPTPNHDPSESLSQCPHLETVNVGTFGSPEYQCTACKASVPRPS